MDIHYGAGLSMVVIAMATISFQCAKAALVNPAESLRSEWFRTMVKISAISA
jgi:hypothetical protein